MENTHGETLSSAVGMYTAVVITMNSLEVVLAQSQMTPREEECDTAQQEPTNMQENELEQAYAQCKHANQLPLSLLRFFRLSAQSTVHS
jgi:hypothetical protein